MARPPVPGIPRPRRDVVGASSRRRPTVSRRRYAARRAVAAAVVVGVVLIVFVLVNTVIGREGGSPETVTNTGGSTAATPDQAGASGTGAVGPGDSDSVATGAPTGSAAVAPGDVSDGTVPGGGEPMVPTADTPARLLIVGDSDAGTFGPFLQTLVEASGVVRTQLDYKVSSGLARPDFFDWPTHLQTLLPNADPDIVVVTFGGNDAQALTDTGGAVLVGVPDGEPGGDTEWRAEYAARVRAVVEALRADGRAVVWVGIPNAVDDDFTARLRVQDETVRAVLAEYPDVRFVDTWARFSGRNGNYAEFVIDPRDGEGKDVRADDGFHLNVAGAEILSLDIVALITEILRAAGAAV